MLDPFGSQNLAGSMDVEDGGSVEDSESGTGSQTASKAIVGFSMAILAGPA